MGISDCVGDPYKLPGGERFLGIYIFPEGIYAG